MIPVAANANTELVQWLTSAKLTPDAIAMLTDPAHKGTKQAFLDATDADIDREFPGLGMQRCTLQRFLDGQRSAQHS